MENDHINMWTSIKNRENKKVQKQACICENVVCEKRSEYLITNAGKWLSIAKN